jgi:hypothetical protein
MQMNDRHEPTQPPTQKMRFMVGDAELCGTSFRGDLIVPFSRLVEVFGEPGEGDGYKVAFEWRITFADGTVAAIYDYKASSLYGDGDDAPTPEQMRANDFEGWHIGGKSARAAELVRAALVS